MKKDSAAFNRIMSDISLFESYGLVSLKRICCFLDVCWNGELSPVEESRDSYEMFYRRCMRLSSTGEKHAQLLERVEATTADVRNLVFKTTKLGERLYGNLSVGVHVYFKEMEKAGFRTLSDIAIFTYIAQGTTTTTDVYNWCINNGHCGSMNMVNKTIDRAMGKAGKNSSPFSDDILYVKKKMGSNKPSLIDITNVGRALYEKAADLNGRLR